MSNRTASVVAIVLLTAALAIGVLNPVFNSLSFLALGMVAAAWFVGTGRFSLRRRSDS